MKILLISGHGAGDPGAVSQFGKEADETIYMVEEIKKTLSASGSREKRSFPRL